MISVIIPAYKARKFLPDCLESIGRQSLLPDEVFVIDDASPEQIDDIINDFAGRFGYPPISLIKHEVNRGQAAGRNTGMKASNSEWLAFLDCDDMWAPNHLESIMNTINTSNADLIFCPAILFDEDPNDPKNYIMGPLTDDERNFRPLSILNRCFIVISSSVIRAESIRKAGAFNEDPMMRGVEDLDLFMRMFDSGAKFHMDPVPTLYYRKHPESATQTIGYLAKQSVHVLEMHIHRVQGSAAEKRALRIQTYWRAAVPLWLMKDHDRVTWVLQAIRHSVCNPYQCLRWTYRFLRALYRQSSYSL